MPSSNCGSVLRTVVMITAFVALSAPLAVGQPIPATSWICANEGVPTWGYYGTPPFWEPMWDSAYYVPGAGSFCDLDPDNPFLAGTGLYDRSLSGHYWAEIWLANNLTPVAPRQVDAELWVGVDQNPGFLLATATVMVTNPAPAARYVFDFGALNVCLCPAELMLKIIYHGPSGDTHIYWDGPSYPTGVRTDAVVGVEPETWGGVKSLYKK